MQFCACLSYAEMCVSVWTTSSYKEFTKAYPSSQGMGGIFPFLWASGDGKSETWAREGKVPLSS